MKRQAITASSLTLGERTKLAIRATIVLFIAFILTRIFHWHLGMWIFITTNVVLKIHAGETVRRGFERLLGHVVGFLIVIPIALIFWQRQLMPFIWTPVLIFLSAYYSLRNYFIYAALLVIIVIYLYMNFYPMGIPGYSIVSFSFIRVLDITLGSALAMAASLVIFPLTTGTPVLKSLSYNFAEMSDFISYIIKLRGDDSKNYNEINSRKDTLRVALANSNELLNSLRAEPAYMRENIKLKTFLLCSQHRLISQLSSFSRSTFIFKGQRVEDFESQIALYLENIKFNFDELSNAIAEKRMPRATLISKDELKDYRKNIYNRYDSKIIPYQQNLHYNLFITILLEMVGELDSCYREITKLYPNS